MTRFTRPFCPWQRTARNRQLPWDADIPLAVLSEKHQLLFYYFTCPMGIATQRPELRKNFCGKPDYVVNFMEFVAQELRMIMAKLGVRTVDKLVGHTEYLRILPHQITQRAAMVDVSGILARCSEENCHYDPAQHFDFKLDATLDKQVLLPLLPKKGKAAAPKCCNVDISCSDRAFGTLFGAEITRRWGSALEDDTYQIHCRGGAGQSFGAFLPKGVTLTLEGGQQRLFRQGAFRRQTGRLRGSRQHVRGCRKRHHRQCRALRRDQAAALLFPALRASDSACAIPVRTSSWKVSATTAASI